MRELITRRVRRLLGIKDDEELDCLAIGSQPIKTITYVEVEKKKRTLQDRKTSRTVTLPGDWLKDRFGNLSWDDKIHVGLWKDPTTGKTLGIFIEYRRKDEGKKE